MQIGQSNGSSAYPENFLVMRYEPCSLGETPEGVSLCATDDELNNLRVSVEIVTKYINFDKEDIDDAVAYKSSQIFNVEASNERNVRGYVSLAANKASLMDKLWSVYSDFFDDEINYLSVDQVSQKGKQLVYIVDTAAN